MAGGNAHQRAVAKAKAESNKKEDTPKTQKESQGPVVAPTQPRKARYWDFIYDTYVQGSVVMFFGVLVAICKDPVWGYAVALFGTGACFSVAIFRKLPHFSLHKKILLVGGIGAVLVVFWSLIPKPEPAYIRLTFKNSEYFTPLVKRQTEKEFNAMRNYLLSLGLKAPYDLPPIQANGAAIQASFPPHGYPTDRGTILFANKYLGDEKATGFAYAYYATQCIFFRGDDGFIQRRFSSPISPKQLWAEFDYQHLAAQVARYFVWSFWNERVDGGYFPPPHIAEAFWDIRGSLQEGFTDQLMAATVKTIAGNPEEGKDPDVRKYFVHKVRIAYRIIESEDKKWPVIAEALQKAGLPSSN